MVVASWSSRELVIIVVGCNECWLVVVVVVVDCRGHGRGHDGRITSKCQLIVG